MDIDADYITKEKRAELELEVRDLEGPKRQEILKALENAKALGDLKENAEYHQAREDQGKLEERIVKIKDILKSSKTVVHSKTDVVEIGSTVVVGREDGGEDKTYIITGSEEADMSQGKISNKSPFGMALFNKKKGEVVSFNAPKGVIKYKIVSVS
jgi:transcription elongation factor GreA